MNTPVRYRNSGVAVIWNRVLNDKIIVSKSLVPGTNDYGFRIAGTDKWHWGHEDAEKARSEGIKFYKEGLS